MYRSKSPLLVIFFTVFLDLLGFGLVIPLLPFFATDLGASGFEVGLLTTVYSAAQFVFAPFWGRLSDRIGRRPVLLVSIGGSVAAMLLFAFSSNLVVFILARAFAGMFNANIGTAQAYIADVTPPEKRAQGMGLMGAAFGLGFVLGPAAGGLLATFGLAAPAFAAAGLAALNLILAFFLLPESLPASARARPGARRPSRLQALAAARRQPLLPLLLLVFFLATLGFSQLETTFALFTEKRFDYGVKENGYLFAFIGIVLVLVQGGLIRPLRRRMDESAILLIGTSLLTVGMILIAWAGSVQALLVACAVIAVGNGLQNPSLSSLVSRQASPQEQGSVLGLNQSMGSLARILGPLLGGVAFDLGGAAPGFAIGDVQIDLAPWSTPFLLAAAILACALIVATRIYRRRPDGADQSAPLPAPRS